MSDTAPTGDAPVVEPAAPVTVAPAAEADPFENTATTTFDRPYVEKLRHEAGDYRTKYAPYRDAFGDVEDDLRDYVLNDIIKPLLTDPASALDELYGIVERIHSTNGTVPKWLEKQITKAEGEIDPDAPLTLKQWQSMQSAEAEKKAQEQGIKTILDEAEALGYPRDAKLDKFGDLASLFQISTTQTKGDLKKAHALRETRFNDAVEAALEVRLQELKDGTRKWAPVTTTGGTPVEKKDEPKTFEEARRRAKARMNQMFND